MHLSTAFILLSLISPLSSLKFLCYSPRVGLSHVKFLGKLADTLIDAGHEVVILSSPFDNRLTSEGTDRARIIKIPVDEIGRTFEIDTANHSHSIWGDSDNWRVIRQWSNERQRKADLCEILITQPGLIEQLRAENFDAGFGESLTLCIGGLFHLVGIERFAVTESIAYKDWGSHLSHVPSAPSYVPTSMGGTYGEEMTFIQRAFNSFIALFMGTLDGSSKKYYQEMFERHYPGFPEIPSLLAQNSLYFLNSDPLVDFPRPSAARIIDIGGIAVSNRHNALNKEWSDIFDLRPKNMFISFGTFAVAHLMPESYKDTIRETAKAFPNVTFIWKYEKPEDNVTRGIPNLMETTWAPQHDMLHDHRLSAFITHCGQASTTEAYYAGVPLLVVPVVFDQIRNAFQVKRSGNGLDLDKSDLGRRGIFQNAVRDILENPKFKKRAVEIAAMLNDKPFTAREVFVRNMEFLAKHGPLRQLDHYGRKLNFIQYYLIDVIGTVVLLVSITVTVTVFSIVKLFRWFRVRLVRKMKNE